MGVKLGVLGAALLQGFFEFRVWFLFLVPQCFFANPSTRSRVLLLTNGRERPLFQETRELVSFWEKISGARGGRDLGEKFSSTMLSFNGNGSR